ncbi:acetyl-CoA carboxylase biotin carboxyl carrier protein [Streptococcus loxodontisalivarius]|uniref:Biotin carboxyl carrier protein of acetyl-CoA carboxylase n=1 Tax=Streptococcus loxodontisalivarius TaxID=1349415 RepID=A0ABS2PTR7_9STRE|nr:acetyl-CoA carboxylase biotin carboxyl carrier protein [Streptococcus loxodontisalivarius]MBM7643427.1 acetyl-CoA carboxylase biotin carboxyl carrier protein [Streptococcus loxodontisalivarius]
MNISEIKDLMSQFDGSSLREFSYRTGDVELAFSKNEAGLAATPQAAPVSPVSPVKAASSVEAPQAAPAVTEAPVSAEVAPAVSAAEGDIVESPLVGVAYLSPAPDKPAFVSVGDSVKKGQTLLIIEAMKVMNEVPAPKDGVVTEILVANEDVVEFGKGLVRIK